MIYLYLKTHNKTGYKYLGKTTSSDPFTYKGSGKLWKRHIEKHGYDVTTEILFETQDKNELKQVGIYYSKLWNVVESTVFANLIQEEGDGGTRMWSEESRKKVSSSLKGVKKKSTLAYHSAQQKLKHIKSIQQKNYLSDPENYQRRCKQLRESYNPKKASNSISQLKWCNDGVRNYRLKNVPENYSLGRL